MTQKTHRKPKGFRQPKGTMFIPAPDGEDLPVISYATSKNLMRRFSVHVRRINREIRAKLRSQRKTKREDGK